MWPRSEVFNRLASYQPFRELCEDKNCFCRLDTRVHTHTQARAHACYIGGLLVLSSGGDVDHTCHLLFRGLIVQMQAYDVATRDYCREVGANFPALRYIKA